MHDEQLLKMFVNLEQKDVIIECLLNYDAISGFTAIPVQGHSRQHASYSLHEQIHGYKDQYMIEVFGTVAELDTLKQQIRDLQLSQPIRCTTHPISANEQL